MAPTGPQDSTKAINIGDDEQAFVLWNMLASSYQVAIDDLLATDQLTELRFGVNVMLVRYLLALWSSKPESLLVSHRYTLVQ